KAVPPHCVEQRQPFQSDQSIHDGGGIKPGREQRVHQRVIRDQAQGEAVYRALQQTLSWNPEGAKAQMAGKETELAKRQETDQEQRSSFFNGGASVAM